MTKYIHEPTNQTKIKYRKACKSGKSQKIDKNIRRRNFFIHNIDDCQSLAQFQGKHRQTTRCMFLSLNPKSSSHMVKRPDLTNSTNKNELKRKKQPEKTDEKKNSTTKIPLPRITEPTDFKDSRHSTN